MTSHSPKVTHQSVQANVIVNVPVISTFTYDFRVVEHLDDNDKVIKYVMQMQIWAHTPPSSPGIFPHPTLIKDWHDVPRVQSKNGKILQESNASVVTATSASTTQKIEYYTKKMLMGTSTSSAGSISGTGASSEDVGKWIGSINHK